MKVGQYWPWVAIQEAKRAGLTQRELSKLDISFGSDQIEREPVSLLYRLLKFVAFQSNH
jgi:hypothetical protein